MKDILFRLFIVLPLYIIWVAFGITLVIPLLYWIISGRSYIDIPMDMPDLEELSDLFK